MVDLQSSFSPLLIDSMEWPSTRNHQVNNEGDSSSTISLQNNLVDSVLTESPPQQQQSYNKSTNLAGHPCAAGCGHFCWAASGEEL